MAKTTIYIALAIGAEEPAYPAYVAFRSPFRFVSGSLVVLPEPSPVALASDGTGTIAVEPGIWLVDEILPTQVFRRAVVVPEATGVVNYSTLVEVTSPIELGYGPSWAALAQQAALAAALSRDEVLAALAALGKGEPGGVASLDENGQVPDDQMPTRLSPASIYAIVGQQIDDRDIPGMIVDALADAGTVEAAAVTAIENAAAGLSLILSTDQRVPSYGIDGTNLEAVIDAASRRVSWRSADGVLHEPLGIDSPRFGVEGDSPGYSVLELDSIGRMLETTLDSSGQLLDSTLRRWRDWRGGLLGIQSVSDVACWGDSMTDAYGGITAYPVLLQTELGSSYSVYAGGKSAQTSTEIAFRQGAHIIRTTFPDDTIPASGSVAVTVTNPGTWRTGIAFSYAVRVRTAAGDWIAGTLTKAADNTWTFSRLAAGVAAATPLDGAATVSTDPDALDLNRRTSIFWVGRNNVSQAATIIADLQAMVAKLKGDKRFLVLSVPNYGGETSGSAGYTTLMATNNAIRAAFPNNFADVRTYLNHFGVADAGLTPTADDITAAANDTIPPSLQYAPEAPGSVHLNLAGRGVVARFVKRALKERGW